MRKNLDFIDRFHLIELKESKKIEFLLEIGKFLQKMQNKFDNIIIDYKNSPDDFGINNFFLEETNKMILVHGVGDSYRNGMLNMLKEIEESYKNIGILGVVFNEAEMFSKKELQKRILAIRYSGIYVPTPIKKEVFVYKLMEKQKTIWESNDKRLSRIKESFLEIINRIEQEIKTNDKKL